MNVTKREFHNLLRILRGIDRHEVLWMTPAQWADFRYNPHTYVIKCSDHDYDLIWAVVAGRPRFVAAEGGVSHAKYLQQKGEML